MKRAAVVIAVGVVAALAAAGSSSVNELAKLSLDDASSLGLRIETDTKIKTEGEGSIKITTASPVTLCLGEVEDLDVDDTTMLYQAKVKSLKLEGTAYLEMWCHVGKGRYFSRGLNSVVTDTMDWKVLQTPFMLKEGQKARKVTLNIVINGNGTVWVDDAHLLRQPG